MRATSMHFAVALLAPALIGAPAAHAAASLVDDFREVFTLGFADDNSAFADWNEVEIPALIHTPFFAGVSGEGDTDGAYANGSAFQDSSASPDKFWGFGYTDGFASIASSGSGDAQAFSQSVFDVGFDLFTAHDYELTGEIFALRAAYDFASVGLLNLDTFQLIEEWTTDDAGNVGFSASGTLGPGFYAMVAFAETFIAIDQGFASGEAWFEFDLTLSAAPVPVPAALWLFASALAGLRLLRRGAN